MKVLVIRANFGKFDAFKPIPEQSIKFDEMNFNELNQEFPMVHLNDRMRARYYKTQMHRLSGTWDYDYFVWIDGSIQVNSGEFIQTLVEDSESYGVKLFFHPDRKTIFEEADFVEKAMKSGNQYLIERYGGQFLNSEVADYIKQGYPMETPLYATTIFCRRNNMFVNSAFNTWWDLILRWSSLDQTAFSFAMWQRNVKVKGMMVKNFIDNSLFTLVPHLR